MQLLSSWNESAKLLLPKNLKLFLLVTAKTVAQTYTVWLKNFWWLIALAFVPLIIPAYSDVQSHILNIMFAFSWFLMVRPSVKRKTISYIAGYGKHFCWYVLVSVALIFAAKYQANIVPGYIIPATSTIKIMGNALYALVVGFWLPHIPYFLMPNVILPIIVFGTLFLLDSDGGVHEFALSYIRSLKMIIYNFPALFVLFWAVTGLLLAVYFILFSAIFAVVSRFFLLLPSDKSYILLCVRFLLPIPLSVLANFYTKRVHEQFTLYYGTREEK